MTKSVEVKIQPQRSSVDPVEVPHGAGFVQGRILFSENNTFIKTTNEISAAPVEKTRKGMPKERLDQGD